MLLPQLDEKDPELSSTAPPLCGFINKNNNVDEKDGQGQTTMFSATNKKCKQITIILILCHHFPILKMCFVNIDGLGIENLINTKPQRRFMWLLRLFFFLFSLFCTIYNLEMIEPVQPTPDAAPF